MRKPQLLRDVFVFGALFGIATTSSAYAQVGLALAPARAELSVKAGEQRTGSLKLFSQSEQAVHLKGEALDFQIDESATARYERDLPREKAVSCKNWLILNPMESEIKKGEVLNVSYTIRPPAQLAEGSYACAAGFTTLPNWPQQQEPENRGAPTVLATVFVTIGNPSVSGSIKELKVEPVGSKTRTPAGWRAVVVVQNSGTMYFRPKGTFEILNAEGSIIESLDFPSLPVLRQRDQRFIFPIHTALNPGSYRFRVRMQIGDKPVQEKTTNVVVDVPSPAKTAEYPFPVFSAEQPIRN